MRVSVFGLGYVGSVSAASFAADGHQVVGVDVNADKVAAINGGKSPIVGPRPHDLLAKTVAGGPPPATPHPTDPRPRTAMSPISLATPAPAEGCPRRTTL